MTNEVENHISEKYEIKKRLGKGAYGIVWKVIDKKTKEVVALKKIFDAFRNKTDAQRTFREIAFLKQFHGHPNIIKLYNVLKAENDKDIYLTFEFMETDLHNVIKRGNILKNVHKQYIMYQLLKATKYLHSANVIHRDQKPSNVLLDSDCFVKLCDFGLARSLSERDNPNPNRDLPPLTEYVATRWYRAPEILMASHKYTKGVDMWSLGCILGEMLLGKALFPGKSTMNQIELILNYIPKPEKEDIETMHKVYGASMITKVNIRPKRTLAELIPNVDNSVMDLVTKLLQFNPDKRITVDESLKHEYLRRFHNPVEEISMEHDVIPPVDDDVQLSVEEYRTRLYQFIMQNKAQKKAKKRPSAKQRSVETDSISITESGSLNNSQSRKISAVNPSTDNKKVTYSHGINDHKIDKSQPGRNYDVLAQEYISSHNSSCNDVNNVSKSGPYVNKLYSSTSPSFDSVNRTNRIKSGLIKHGQESVYNNSSLIEDQKLKYSHSYYNNQGESDVVTNSKDKVAKSKTYNSKRSLDHNDQGNMYDYPGRKPSALYNKAQNNDVSYPSSNQLRKSQSVKNVEHDIYRRSMFSSGLTDNDPLNTSYPNYSVHENLSDIYDYGFDSRPRSRSIRASYSNYNDNRIDSGNVIHKVNQYSGSFSSNKAPTGLKSRGSYDNLTKNNSYDDYSSYNKGNEVKSSVKNSNNNNMSDTIGLYASGSRPPSRGLSSALYEQNRYSRDASYLKMDPKRHQSAPLGYTSSVNASNKPPTSGLVVRDSSLAKSRNQYPTDVNDRMVSRSRAPSSKLEKTRTTGSYYRSSSPGLRYLPSEYNQRPTSKSGSYEDSQRYSQTYGSLSGNQLAHYYSRKWIS